MPTQPSIIAIGDIHGLETWKQIVRTHPGCKFIFLGDYLDPYNYIPETKLIANLQEIIELKRQLGDSVVLLLGNHDLHYMTQQAPRGSRYNPAIAKKAASLLSGNDGLFQYACEERGAVFTHAGIIHKWFTDDFRGDLSQPIAAQLNQPKGSQMEALFSLGYPRGGMRGDRGGIFWADDTELRDPLHGVKQVAGHNRVTNIKTCTGDDDNEITFCDSLWNGNYLYWE